MERRRESKEPEGKVSALLLGKCLLFSYIITGLLLVLLAFLLYRFELSAKMVSVGIVVIYVVSTFLAGFITGKRIGNKKFFWGFVMGSAYFIVLLIVSLVANRSVSQVSTDFVTTLLICAGSGMLGGMLG
ncbi:MAG: TIGR04086 family membrane protein [Lachnospiraceae bacterium]|nr:TIGR04086 family membrane protein [Lachnospiraceae bacterium]